MSEKTVHFVQVKNRQRKRVTQLHCEVCPIHEFCYSQTPVTCVILKLLEA